MTLLSTGEGNEVLFSYDTPVAGFKHGMGYFKTNEYFSPTTTKHINKYLDSTKAILVNQINIDSLVC
jgi:hypothetical protein